MRKCDFNGSIVITDPCYIMRENSSGDNYNEWDRSEYGERMDLILCTSNFICESTIYGDWSCTCWKGHEALDLTSDDIEKMSGNEKDSVIYGEFTADSGMVIVAYLKDIIMYNPNFSDWAKSHNWCATIIEDFNGTVEYHVAKRKYDEKDAEKYGKAFMERASTYCYLIGYGNKDFITSQTGL